MMLLEIVTLLAGVAHATPALQHPLTLAQGTAVPTKVIWSEHSTSSSSSTSESSPCSTPSLTSVTFNELAVTFYGEEVYLVGGVSNLGDWNPDSAVQLNSSKYTEEKPLWYVTVEFPVDSKFEYKYIRKEPDGNIVWESDPNRSYTVEGNCDGNATENNSWR